jgi:hypothetical protein
VPAVLWPDRRLLCAATLALLLKLPKLLEDAGLAANEALYGIRTSEVQELLIASTLFLYALLLKQRIDRDGATARRAAYIYRQSVPAAAGREVTRRRHT